MNNIDQVLQYVDDLMFEKVESHLTPVQEAIFILKKRLLTYGKSWVRY